MYAFSCRLPFPSHPTATSLGLIPTKNSERETIFSSPATLIFPPVFVVVRALLVRLPDDYFWLLNCGWLSSERRSRGWHDDGKNVYTESSIEL